MRYIELHESSAAKELKEKLPSLKKTDYDTIDNLMRRISKRYNITGKKLHDLFVSRYGHTPDHWIKAYKKKLDEFSPPGDDDREYDPEEILHRLASQWWNGTEQEMIKAQRTLEAMGWEIGEDEGYDNGGVFVIRIGDINGNSYISWPHEDLTLDEGVAEGWQDQAQDIDDWSKEVNKKLYKAHTSQRAALAQQLSKIENQHFGSKLNKGGLTSIVHSALKALQRGDMVHYDPEQVGQMPFGSMVGGDARDIANAGLSKYEVAGYNALKRLHIVDNLDEFLELLTLANSKGILSNVGNLIAFNNMRPEEAFVELAKLIGWNKKNPTSYNLPQDVDEGQVIPFKRSNPLTPNVITQLKALSQTALELFWEGSYMPTAAQGQMAKLGKKEESRLFADTNKRFKALGYEYSIHEEDMDKLFLHSIAREAWYDAEKPPNQFNGMPDLIYDRETNTLSYYDLIGDEGYEYTDTRQFDEGTVVPLKRPMSSVQHGKRVFPPKQRDVKEPEGNVTPLKKKDSQITESVDNTEQIKDFIKWTIRRLHIKKPYPRILLSNDTAKAKAGTHTGVHTPEDNTIWVYTGNRNLIDILRTVFHELVHERQTQLNMIQPGDSYPGSPIEAMADMLAGKYIKIYGKQHPEIFQ